MVKSTVTSYADQRVQVISKRVMTTATLLDIIKRYNLYPREQSRDTREELPKLMRDDIGLKMISADVIDPRSGRPLRRRSPSRSHIPANRRTRRPAWPTNSPPCI